MDSQKKIVIVGAGLVGSLLGVMLGRRGNTVHLFERRSDNRAVEADSGRSINLALSSRGIRALSEAGLYEKVKPLLTPMRGRMLHQTDGTQQFSPYGQRDHEVIYSVPRDELNRLMVNEAVLAEPVLVHFDHSCEQIDFENRNVTFRNTRNGSQLNESFDVIIGADGAGSEVRKQLIDAVGGTSSSEFLPHDYKELEIPAAEDGSHRIEKNALHIWPRGGFMLIALPNLDGSFTVTLFLAKSGDPGFDSLTDSTRVREFFETHFASAIPLMPDFAADFFENPAGRLGTIRCDPWFHSDCGLILGDASHAIVPFHGQGMNSGFEDCSELLRLLNNHQDDWGTVLPAFSAIRKPNADAIADMAIENHTTMQQSVMDPGFHLKKELGFVLENRHPNHFIPRYSLVMFHNIPYTEAKQRGTIQQEILTELVGDMQAAEDIHRVNLESADELILSRLSPVEITN